MNLAACIRIFGLQRRHLDSRNIEPGADKLYDVEEVVTGAMDHILNKYSKGVEEGTGDDGLGSIKAQREVEALRKIRMENDERAGLLVPTENMAATYGIGLKLITSVLEGIPAAVKIAHPDISQEALATINEKILEARNKASSLDFDKEFKKLKKSS